MQILGSYFHKIKLITLYLFMFGFYRPLVLVNFSSMADSVRELFSPSIIV